MDEGAVALSQIASYTAMHTIGKVSRTWLPGVDVRALDELRVPPVGG